MGTISAKQLKQRTGEIMKRVISGERLTVTYRGKPVALISPTLGEQDGETEDSRPVERAWSGIEAALRKTEPRFRGWREATEWVRKRI